jgi:predicted RNase H-like nuclease (RuvC/YqgF family)
MTDENTDFEGLREEIEEHQAAIDALREQVEAIEREHDPAMIEAAGLDLAELRSDLDERDKETEELRESLSTAEMFSEALAAGDEDPRGYR